MSDNQITLQKIIAAQKMLENRGNIAALIPPPMWQSEPSKPFVESYYRTAVEARERQRAFDCFIIDSGVFVGRVGLIVNATERHILNQIMKKFTSTWFPERKSKPFFIPTWSRRRRRRAIDLFNRRNQLKPQTPCTE